MGRKPNVYSKIAAADEMIKKLCEKHPKILWAVRPEQVVVLGIDNKERSKKNRTLAKIRPVKGTEKAIYQVNNIPIRYVCECYWSDWHLWSDKERKAILFHELMHVHPEGERTIKHDCEDFRVILGCSSLGVDWFKKGNKLPDLTEDDVEFDLNLLPAIDDEESEEDDIEDDKKNKEKKKAKRDSLKGKEEEPEGKEDIEETEETDEAEEDAEKKVDK